MSENSSSSLDLVELGTFITDFRAIVFLYSYLLQIIRLISCVLSTVAYTLFYTQVCSYQTYNLAVVHFGVQKRIIQLDITSVIAIVGDMYS